VLLSRAVTLGRTSMPQVWDDSPEIQSGSAAIRRAWEKNAGKSESETLSFHRFRRSTGGLRALR